MNKIERKRLDIGIGYFVREFYKKTKKPPTQMNIYKFLAFVDFYSVKRRGKPVFGLKYSALRNGPVPSDLYKEIKNVSTVRTYPYYKVIAKDKIRKFFPLEGKELDLSYFAKAELEIINEVIYILIDSSLNTYHYSEASHQKINAWKKAYQSGEGTTMKYEDEIEDEFLREVFEGYKEVETIKRG